MLFITFNESQTVTENMKRVNSSCRVDTVRSGALEELSGCFSDAALNSALFLLLPFFFFCL